MRLIGPAVLLWTAASASAQPATDPSDVARVQAWLAGEWNNHEQVWQQRIDAANPKLTERAPAVAHRQAVVRPAAPDGTQPLAWHAGVVHGRGAAQGATNLRAVAAGPGAVTLHLDTTCSLTLRWDAAARSYQGSSEPGRCTIAGDRRQVQTTLASGLWQWLDRAEAASEPATPLRLRRQRYYEGWVWFRNAGPGAASDDKDTSFTARFALHNEGQRMVLLRKDGSESPWELEFAVLTYQNTRRAILKFGLVDRATGKSLAYTWAHPDSPNIGMNLGWFQSGLTLRPEGQNLYGD
ncbi:MAG: hypothetical protein ACOVOT_08475 [Rubrivivax sp.]